MSNELFKQIANEIKKQITRLNLVDKFTLFKADEFSFTNRAMTQNKGNYYKIGYVMEIHHPLTGYKIIVDNSIEDVEIAATEILGVMVKDFTGYFNNNPTRN